MDHENGKSFWVLNLKNYLNALHEAQPRAQLGSKVGDPKSKDSSVATEANILARCVWEMLEPHNLRLQCLPCDISVLSCPAEAPRPLWYAPCLCCGAGGAAPSVGMLMDAPF